MHCHRTRSRWSLATCRVCAYVLVLLKEPKTWRSVVLIATGLGAKFSPQNIETIVTTGLLVAGILGATLHDRKSQRRGDK